MDPLSDTACSTTNNVTHSNPLSSQAIEPKVNRLVDELTPLSEELMGEMNYITVKNILLCGFILGLASVRAEMTDSMAELWEHDKDFEGLWRILPFTDVTKGVEKFRTTATAASSSEQRVAHPATIHKDCDTQQKMKQDLMTKFHIFRTHHPGMHIPVIMTTDMSINEMESIYQECLYRRQREVEYGVYKNLKQLILTGMLLGSEMLKRFLSPEMYMKARTDPGLQEIWDLVPGMRREIDRTTEIMIDAAYNP